jgi:hypothetical protein
MAQRRRRPRRIDVEVREQIEMLAAEGLTGPQIIRRLELDEKFADRMPSLRTVQSLVREFQLPAIQTDEDAWSVATAPADEAQHVLRVLGCVIDQSGGRVTRLRRDHAAWIARIASAVPHMDAWSVYLRAGEYVKAVERGDSGGDLDRGLAKEAWAPTAKALEAKGEAFARGEPGPLPWIRPVLRGMVRVPHGEVVDDQTRLLVLQAQQELEEQDND